MSRGQDSSYLLGQSISCHVMVLAREHAQDVFFQAASDENSAL